MTFAELEQRIEGIVGVRLNPREIHALALEFPVYDYNPFSTSMAASAQRSYWLGAVDYMQLAGIITLDMRGRLNKLLNEKVEDGHGDADDS